MISIRPFQGANKVSKVNEFHSEPETADILGSLRDHYADDHGEILNDGYHCEVSGEIFPFSVEKRDIGTSEEYIIWELWA